MAQDREPSRLSSNTPGLIIFDCNGVLVDSEVIYFAVDEIVLADLGWRIGADEKPNDCANLISATKLQA